MFTIANIIHPFNWLVYFETICHAKNYTVGDVLGNLTQWLEKDQFSFTFHGLDSRKSCRPWFLVFKLQAN